MHEQHYASLEIAIQKVKQFSPELQNKVIEFIELLEFQGDRAQKKPNSDTVGKPLLCSIDEQKLRNTGVHLWTTRSFGIGFPKEKCLIKAVLSFGSFSLDEQRK